MTDISDTSGGSGAIPLRPRLRPVQHHLVGQGDDAQLVLEDPTGIVDAPIAMTPMSSVLLECFDGTRTLDDVVRAIRERHAIDASRDVVEGFVRGLDEHGFLDSPRFEARRRAANAGYREQGRRAPAFAGVSYSADASELSRELASSFRAIPLAVRRDPPLGLIVPHIDLRVAETTYAAAYAAFANGHARPDVVVLFGTAHALTHELFIASSIGYDTPLGPCPVAEEVLEDIVRRYPGELFADECLHRTEHSLEFQAVYLRHVFGERVPPILPFLCGSLVPSDTDPTRPERQDEVDAMVTAIAETARERHLTVTVIAGADMAHVGPRFEDPEPVDEEQLEALEGLDRETLETVAAGDSGAFFRSVSEDGNPRRICGLSAVYATMAWTGQREADVVAYHQWVEDGSVVSFASAIIDG